MSDEKEEVGALCVACFLSVFLQTDRDEMKMTWREPSEDPGALRRSSVGMFSLAAAGIRLTLRLKEELYARSYGGGHAWFLCWLPV